MDLERALARISAAVEAFFGRGKHRLGSFGRWEFCNFCRANARPGLLDNRLNSLSGEMVRLRKHIPNRLQGIPRDLRAGLREGTEADFRSGFKIFRERFGLRVLSSIRRRAWPVPTTAGRFQWSIRIVL